ncbi:hypothetical protein AK812_SmicGene21968 [Symbiodinium microadriaticum]|uniref:Uncharacterized protein n=1 Tax=Symbiodinium microadriaticum TaxID=2951 RepID=A0A1Q9DL02_SYMMI|nr:hypothetical protein AK812_SmicGene21968 [Symbiodinium microadriaticum]
MAQLISLRLLLAFLLAACGRGRAPVGFVQHLPAIKTLQGRMGEMAKKARRLQTGLDQECMTKCPGLLFMMTDLMSGMQTNPPAGDNASDATAGFDALASMMGAMFSAMCKHSAAMTCMVTECAAPTNGDSGEIGVESLEQFMPCLCDACPGFVDLFTSLGSTAALLENNTNITEVGPQALTALCPMVSATECLTTNAACSAFVQSNGELGAEAGDISMIKSQCEEAGIATGPSTTTTTAADVSSSAITFGAGAFSVIAGLIWS